MGLRGLGVEAEIPKVRPRQKQKQTWGREIHLHT